MLFFAAFIAALAVTMAVIPVMVRVADRLHLLDQPDERKVHAGSIPNVGGIGMVLGILLPVALWVPLDREIIAFLIGVGVLFVFGVWDDRGDLDYRLKFFGQIVAAVVVVVYGDVAIRVLPFFGMDPVSPWISMPFTVFVLVAITNAINLADGLDGLAAGTTLLSLSGIAILAYLADGMDLLMISIIVMGVIAGFLRFNTYPARIFMGDTGSQFLGFSAGTLSIILTQGVNPALNPALPLLLLGVPLFDTMFVMLKRLYYGMSPFSADKNHIHHHLLLLRFDHYEAVVIIYLMQALFVLCGVLLCYYSDAFIVGTWMVANILLAFLLVWAGRAQWRAHDSNKTTLLARLNTATKNASLAKVAEAVLVAGLILQLIAGSLLASEVTLDLSVASGVLFVLLLSRLVLGYKLWFISLRLLLYVAVAFVLYLTNEYPSVDTSAKELVVYIFYGVMIFALILVARHTREAAFRITPTDFLIVLFMLGIAFIPQLRIDEALIVSLVIKMVVMFYTAEVVLRSMNKRWNSITAATLITFGLIAGKGMLAVV